MGPETIFMMLITMTAFIVVGTSLAVSPAQAQGENLTIEGNMTSQNMTTGNVAGVGEPIPDIDVSTHKPRPK